MPDEKRHRSAAAARRKRLPFLMLVLVASRTGDKRPHFIKALDQSSLCKHFITNRCQRFLSKQFIRTLYENPLSNEITICGTPSIKNPFLFVFLPEHQILHKPSFQGAGSDVTPFARRRRNPKIEKLLED